MSVSESQRVSRLEAGLRRTAAASAAASAPAGGGDTDNARLNEVESVAGTAGMGGSRVGPDTAADNVVRDGSVHAALPGFTVLSSGLSDEDSEVFIVVNPSVVYFTEVWSQTTDQVPKFTMGNSVWCNIIVDTETVTIKSVEISPGRMGALADDDDGKLKLVTVHIADITPDRVVQYHTGAVVVTAVPPGSGSAKPDDVSIDERDNKDATNDGKLQIKDWNHETPPAADKSVADDLLALAKEESASDDKVVVRTKGKELKYKSLGLIPKADKNNFGVVKPDGTTITAKDGVLTAVSPSSDRPYYPFEPVFNSNGALEYTIYNTYPYGRKFLLSGRVNDNAKVTTGLIGLKITHSSGSSNSSAEVVLTNSGEISDNSSSEFTVIPLYQIYNGKITVDYRCLMALAIRE